MPDKVQEDTAKDDSLTEFLKMEGTWSDDAEGEEYYQMMKHRNDGRPLNREIIRQAIARQVPFGIEGFFSTTHSGIFWNG